MSRRLSFLAIAILLAVSITTGLVSLANASSPRVSTAQSPLLSIQPQPANLPVAYPDLPGEQPASFLPGSQGPVSLAVQTEELQLRQLAGDTEKQQAEAARQAQWNSRADRAWMEQQALVQVKAGQVYQAPTFVNPALNRARPLQVAPLAKLSTPPDHPLPLSQAATYTVTVAYLHRNDSMESSAFVITNTGSAVGSFSIYYYWANHDFQSAETRVIGPGSTYSTNLRFAPLPGIFYGYAEISSDQTFSTAITTPDYGVILGQVFQDDGVTPQAGVSVELHRRSGEGVGSMGSLGDGYYFIGGLRDGDYVLHTSPGYPWAKEFYNNQLSFNSADTLTISGASHLINNNFVLEHGGVISGTVYAPDGVTPLPNINVDLEEGWFGACTDAEGHYRLEGVPYRAWNYVIASRDGNWCLNKQSEYVQQYYSGALLLQDATGVVLSSTQDQVGGIDFTLQSGSKIKGRVTDQNTGLPLANVHVAADKYDGGGLWVNAWTDANGEYTLGALADQEYRLRVDDGRSMPGYAAEYWKERRFHHQADRIQVTGPITLTNYDFTLEPGGVITGYVTDQSTGLPLVNINVNADPLSRNGGYGSCTDSAGYFEMWGMTYDDYAVRAGGDWNYCLNQASIYIKEYFSQTAHFDQAQPIHIAAGHDRVGGLTFTLEQGGSISGRVTSAASGAGLANARVQASIYDNEWYWAEAYSDADGYYTISGLVEGDYRVRIDDWNQIPEGYAVQYYNNSIYYNQAERVNVPGKNSVANINFALQPGGAVSGRVIDQATGLPLVNQNVNVSIQNGGWGAGACTDSDGNYRMHSLPYSTFMAEAGGGWNNCQGEQSLYARELYSETVQEWQRDSFNVDAGTPQVGNINFSLIQGGYFTGHVQDNTGAPVNNVYMGALIFNPDCPWCHYWYEKVTTDVNGDYLLGPIPPGKKFHIYACTGCNNLPWVDEFYNDVYQIMDGEDLTVTVGTNTIANFVLDPGIWLTGHVTVPSGYSNADIKVDAWTTRLQAGYGTNRRTDQNGDFIVPVPAFEQTYWALQANPGKTDLASQRAHDFDINRQTRWDFNLGPGGSITGCLTDENGDPVPWANINADAMEVNNGNQTGPDGCYQITNLPPAAYRVRADKWPDYQYMHYGGHEWDWAEIIHLKLAETVGNINFIVPHKGRIDGKVTASASGAPLEGINVLAINSTGFWQIGSQPDGTYGIDLPVGDYRVYYDASKRNNNNPDWYQSLWYGGTMNYAAALTVTVPAYTTGALVLDRALVSMAKLHGRVVEAASGKPAGGVKVSTFYQDQPGFIYAGASSCTDGSGEYFIDMIPGTHLVTAVGLCGGAKGFQTVTQTVTLAPGEDRTLDFNVNYVGLPPHRFTVRVDDSWDYTPLSLSNLAWGGSPTNQILPFLFTPLVQMDDQGNWTTELLEKVPLPSNGGAAVINEQLVVTYTLKPGLLWSDGEPLTSADIAYAWQWHQNPNPWMDWGNVGATPLFKIERMETPDALTAVAYYRPRELPTNYLEALPYPYPQHAMQSLGWMDIRWGTEFSHNPVGNGPYVVEDYLPGAYLDLRANPNYYRRGLGYPKITELRLQFDGSRFWELADRFVDVSLDVGGELPDNYQDFDLNFQSHASMNFEQLYLNLDLPLFQDVQVRRALAHALDKDSLYNFPQNKVADTWLPPDNPMYSDPGYTRYGFDLDQAASLLTAAGWVDGDADGIREKDGKELAFTLSYNDNNPWRVSTALRYQQDLESIGVKLILNPMPREDYFENVRRGVFEAWLLAWGFGSQSNPPGYSFFHSSQIPTAYNNWGTYNISRWSDTDNDTILAKANVELEPAVLKSFYAQQLLRFGDQIPGIPTQYGYRIDAATPTLLNFKPQESIPVTWNAAEWETPANPYDLLVRKALAAGSPAAMPGAEITYEVFVQNAGFFTMTNATLVDILPALTSFVSADPAPSQVVEGKLYWNLGDIPSYTSLPPVKVTVQVDPAAVHGNQLLNQVSVYADQTDSRPENNAFLYTLTVRQDVDLAVEKSGAGLPVIGEKFDYYLNYANWGGAPASDVVITDTLPSKVLLLSASPAPSSVSGNTLTWEFASLAGNQWGGQIVLHTEIDSAGTVTNQARIDGEQAETNLANNADDHTANVESIMAPMIVQPTEGTTGKNPTLEGLAPSNSIVDFYDMTSTVLAEWSGEASPLAYTWLGSTTATITGTFSLKLALSEGSYSIVATATKGGLTSAYSPAATFVVDHHLNLDPDYVEISAEGVKISDGVVRSERRALPYEQLDLQARLNCPSQPSVYLAVTENGLFNYNLPPVNTTDLGGGDWLEQFRIWLGDPRSSYEIKLHWTCGGSTYEEVLIYILIDPEGYLYDQSQVDAGSTITNSLVLNGVITTYVSTESGWKVWPAAVYGQVNPQVTDGTTDDGVTTPGYYSFLTPAGRYRLEATAPGYQPYQSEVLTVINQPIHLDIGLKPVVGGQGVSRKPASLVTSNKKVDKSQAWVGDELTYDIQLFNTGELSTDYLTLSDPLHERVSYVEDSLTLSGDGTFSYNPATHSIEWYGKVAAGAGIHLHYRVHVDSTGGLPYTIASTAKMSGPAENLQGISPLAANTEILNQVGVNLQHNEAGAGNPGEAVSFIHTITNTGNAPDTFSFNAFSSRGWTVDKPANVTLSPGSSTTVQVTAHIPAGTPYNTTGTLTLTAQSGYVASITSSVTDQLTVNRVVALSVSSSAAWYGKPGKTVTYKHTLTNLGNAPDTFLLSAVSNHGWVVEVSPNPTLAGGSSTTITVVVHIPAGALDGMVDTVTLTVASQTDATKTSIRQDVTTVKTSFKINLPVMTRNK